MSISAIAAKPVSNEKIIDGFRLQIHQSTSAQIPRLHVPFAVRIVPNAQVDYVAKRSNFISF